MTKRVALFKPKGVIPYAKREARMFLIITLSIIISVGNSTVVMAKENIVTEIVDFPVTINYEEYNVDDYNANDMMLCEYPMVVYKNMTYIPLTYYNCTSKTVCSALPISKPGQEAIYRYSWSSVVNASIAMIASRISKPRRGIPACFALKRRPNTSPRANAGRAVTMTPNTSNHKGLSVKNQLEMAMTIMTPKAAREAT